MRNATRDLLRVSLTVGAVAAVLLCAELSAPSPLPVHDGATARADSVIHARSILIDRGDVRQDSGEPAPAVTLGKPSRKLHSLLALAQ